MKAADVFVFGFVIPIFGLHFRGDACATPVVATRTEGAQELIEAGKSGLLVDVGRRTNWHPRSETIDDGSLRRRLGGEAAIHCKRTVWTGQDGRRDRKDLCRGSAWGRGKGKGEREDGA